MKKIFRNEQETCEFAAQLATKIQPGDVIALSGELGAGKSVFARALMRALGVADEALPSPTYAIIQEYDGENCKVTHMDWYRLSDSEEVEMLGVRDFFVSPWVAIIEWPERSLSSLPDTTIHLLFSYVDGHVEQRKVEVI